jgi:hypothetical protein
LQSCFTDLQINLPFGGVAAAAVVFLLPARDPERRLNQVKLPLGKALLKMDYLGSALILACVTCLLLALQWGGNDYPWGSECCCGFLSASSVARYHLSCCGYGHPLPHSFSPSRILLPPLCNPTLTPDWRIILLFVLGGLLVIAFGAWQWYIDENALIPMIILKNRTEVASAGAMFMLMLAMLGGTYQLPLFYQAVSVTVRHLPSTLPKSSPFT